MSSPSHDVDNIQSSHSISSALSETRSSPLSASEKEEEEENLTSTTATSAILSPNDQGVPPIENEDDQGDEYDSDDSEDSLPDSTYIPNFQPILDIITTRIHEAKHSYPTSEIKTKDEHDAYFRDVWENIRKKVVNDETILNNVTSPPIACLYIKFVSPKEMSDRGGCCVCCLNGSDCETVYVNALPEMVVGNGWRIVEGEDGVTKEQVVVEMGRGLHGTSSIDRELGERGDEDGGGVVNVNADANGWGPVVRDGDKKLCLGKMDWMRLAGGGFNRKTIFVFVDGYQEEEKDG